MGIKKIRRKNKETKCIDEQTVYENVIYGLVKYDDVAKYAAPKNDGHVISAVDDDSFIDNRFIW